jgi:hypothetical protein
MYSVNTIQNVVTSLLPHALLKECHVQLHAWNRTKDDVSDAEFQESPHDDFDDDPVFLPYGSVRWSTRSTPIANPSITNQKIGEFSVDIPDWDRQCYIAKHDANKEEVGIGLCIFEAPLQWDPAATYDSIYLAMIDFNPGLMTLNRHTHNFWKDCAVRLAGHKIWIFDSGNAHHAIINRLHANEAHSEWLSFLASHEEVVDQKWVKFAQSYSHGGVIRVTEGRTRPKPKLVKYINF